MANGKPVNGNGGEWTKTVFGAIGGALTAVSAVFVLGQMLIIGPQNARIEKVEKGPITERLDKLEAGREKDSDQLAKLYTSIQTNDEYKKTIEKIHAHLRSDIDKTSTQITRIADEQQRRTSPVASIASITKRIDRIDQRTEEAERRSTPTIIEEVRNLRNELQDLRKRIMIPITATTKE
jgi:predicted  nucleic acid-binding Zn-ribbon protein